MSYLLFAGHRFYPIGGIDDLVARGTISELKDYFQASAEEIAGGSYIDNWGQIVDTVTLRCFAVGTITHAGGNLSEPGIATWEDML